MKGSLRVLVVAGLTLLMGLTLGLQECRAWNDLGHWIITRIAYDQLTDAERLKIHAILRQHPHYDRYLKADNHDGASEAEWTILRSSTWSDYVRPGRPADVASKDLAPYHKGIWHYVDFPVNLAQRRETLPEKPLPAETNVLRQLELTKKILLREEANDPDQVEGLSAAQNRAIRLCWLNHLVGDLHQPLHVASLIDEAKFPRREHNDQGGNLLIAKREIVNRPEKLHAIWDQMLGTDAYYPAAARTARRWTSDESSEPAALPELERNKTFTSWAEESYLVAEKYVYRRGDDEVKFEVYHDDPKQRVPESRVPVLPRGYLSLGQEVAIRRACLAGYRLGRLLSEVAANE